MTKQKYQVKVGNDFELPITVVVINSTPLKRELSFRAAITWVAIVSIIATTTLAYAYGQETGDFEPVRTIVVNGAALITKVFGFLEGKIVTK